MAKWNVVGTVVGGKFLGTVEADTEEEAIDKGELLDTHVSLCHQCANECEDPEVTQIHVSKQD